MAVDGASGLKRRKTAPAALPRVVGVSAPFVRQHFVDKEGGEWQPQDKIFDVRALAIHMQTCNCHDASVRYLLCI